MNTFEPFVKLLAAIHAFEREANPSYVLFSPDALGMTAKEQDDAAVLLEYYEYITGMKKDYDEGSKRDYDWRRSFPRITLKGYEYIETNEALRKEIKRLHMQAVNEARAKIANAIEEFAGD